MSFFDHNVYDNVRTRAIVIHAGALLLLPPPVPDEGWRMPGGGLEPGESLADCVRREVLEETGIAVAVGRVAFMREWVAPTYCAPPEGAGRPGFGLEVFFYATPVATHEAPATPRPESQDEPAPIWVALAEVPALSIWPIELKSLARHLAEGAQPAGIHSFVTDFEPLSKQPDPIDW